MSTDSVDDPYLGAYAKLKVAVDAGGSLAEIEAYAVELAASLPSGASSEKLAAMNTVIADLNSF